VSDIIETLRRLQCSDAACGDLRIAMGAKLAIYEIERLREQLRLANIDAFQSEADASQLRAERDEARRHLCDLYVKGQPSSSNMTDKDYAAELDWDCFKEDGK
jgi:hypothetical protein